MKKVQMKVTQWTEICKIIGRLQGILLGMQSTNETKVLINKVIKETEEGFETINEKIEYIEK